MNCNIWDITAFKKIVYQQKTLFLYFKDLKNNLDVNTVVLLYMNSHYKSKFAGSCASSIFSPLLQDQYHPVFQRPDTYPCNKVLHYMKYL